MSRAAVDVTHVRYPFVLPKFNPEGLLQRYIYIYELCATPPRPTFCVQKQVCS